MDKAKLSATDFSSNMLGFPTNKEERVLAHILATTFHTEPVIDSQLEVRLNPTIKDLVINRPAAKKKRVSSIRRRNLQLKRPKVLERINRSG
jgi:hypothetical protein